MPKIAIIGAGVSGTTAALYLGSLGLDITLFEKEESLVNGPPFCHLHAGGNLYREISDTQCITLLKQSIDFLRFYPFIVDYRPTVIILPSSDKSTPEALLPRLHLLRTEYERLISLDAANEVLGKSHTYYQTYNRETLEILRNKPSVQKPTNADEWMIPVAKHIDFEKVQFPLIMVQEYGLNLFRLASGTKLALNTLETVTLHTKSVVHNIQNNYNDTQWKVSYMKENISYQENFDYLINAAGFRTGKIDDMLGAPCKSMVEFKAAYISYWEAKKESIFPEIIFHGERGTPQGMGQFTPYPHGYFQLHGMTHDITLYEDGLVSNTEVSCQAKLGQSFLAKIQNNWTKDEISIRTNAAIQHLAQFIPTFSTASVGSRPLFGAQQIPGDDPTLRVAEVSFPRKRYARCEIVKVSSVLDMLKEILVNLHTLGFIQHSTQPIKPLIVIQHLKENLIQQQADAIAKQRGYVIDLASRNVMETSNNR